MQPTTNQTVPATSHLPSQTADRQPSTMGQAPAPALLDAEALRHISGGVSTSTPVGAW
jgi:hypothetical protein